jgi:hypothetical protein
MVLYDWIHQRVGIAHSTDFCALGRVVGKDLIGVVGYNGHNGKSCRMHMAGEGQWITRDFLAVAFYLPFVQWGYEVVFAEVPSGNERALDIDIRLGFQKLDTIPGAHPDGALHFLMMRKENCRWIKRRTHG